MSTIRTSSVFHNTRTFDNLKSILTEGLRPNICLESYSDGSGSLYKIGIPMVSFCDIPLTRMQSLSRRYGSYGIGLKKEWAINNDVNPILYITSKLLINSLNNLKNNLRLIEDNRNSIYAKHSVSNPETGETVVPISSSENRDVLNNFILQHSETYAYKYFHAFSKYIDDIHKVKDNDYLDNEWRYPLITSLSDWLWNEDDYNKWERTQIDSNGVKKKSVYDPLIFNREDITYIIVKRNHEISELINFIELLDNVGGSDKGLNQDDSKLLMTKIISLETIENDF